ncbi:MAG: high-potential iron-sulfur protein [Acidiferrobacterales bacterium]|nr:high-potential iron-sulfur protein [Acidiferrobacterales bacterium]
MSPFSRRTFLCTAAVVPLQTLFSGVSFAEGLSKLGEQESLAVALGYQETSTNPDQICANCSLYAPDSKTEWGQCAIFPGKLVAAQGWCKSWVVKPG